MERRKGKKIAKVATGRKLLEWIYHMLKEKKTFWEVENIADSWGEFAILAGHQMTVKFDWAVPASLKDILCPRGTEGCKNYTSFSL